MPTEEDTPEEFRGKWLAAAEEMRSRIDAGRWRSGQKLPSALELCGDFAITHPTLRKAMARLAGAGLVEPLARGWRVAVRGKAAAGMAVGFVRRCDAEGRPVMEADREVFFRRALEIESSRRGLRLERWGLSSSGELFRGRERWCGNLSRVLGGLVVSLWHFEDPSEGLGPLRAVSVPVALWDERSLVVEKPAFSRARWFRSGLSEQAGRTVGRHLIDLGHRSLAWISPFQGSVWSTRRSEGLDAVCREAVPAARVEYLTLDDRWAPSQFTPDPAQVRALLSAFEPSVPDVLLPALERVVEEGRILLRDGELLRDLEGLFQRALESRDLTAWVCANDDIARLAWAWLDRRGVVVGRDIALAGFDNSLRAQDLGLTSVGFREEDLAAGMISYLLDPGRWRTGGSVALEGALVVRGSTGFRPS